MLTPDIADQNATNQQKQHQEYQIKRSSKKQNHHQENTNKNKRCPKPEDIHHCREHQRWQTLSQAKMYPPLQRRPKMTNAVQNQKISTTAEKTKDDKRYSKPEDIHHCREEQRWPMTREPTGWTIKEATYNQERQGERIVQETNHHQENENRSCPVTEGKWSRTNFNVILLYKKH